MTHNEELIKKADTQLAFFRVHETAVNKFEEFDRILDDDQPDAFDALIENLIAEVPDAEGLIMTLADADNAIEIMTKIFSNKLTMEEAFEKCCNFLTTGFVENKRVKKITLGDKNYIVEYAPAFEHYFITEENSSFQLTGDDGEHENFNSIEDAEAWLADYVAKQNKPLTVWTVDAFSSELTYNGEDSIVHHIYTTEEEANKRCDAMNKAFAYGLDDDGKPVDMDYLYYEVQETRLETKCDNSDIQDIIDENEGE